MTDAELIRLGVTTIGERIRLRAVCRDTTASSSTPVPSSASIAAERARLFHPRHARGTARKRKASQPAMRPWTGNIFCLADRLQSSIPSTTTKQTLHNAGLRLKKIKFHLTDK